MNRSVCLFLLVCVLGIVVALGAGHRPRHKRLPHIREQGFGKKTKKTPAEVGKFYPIKRFTSEFALYDTNNDGQISLSELIHVTGRAGHVRRAFRASDINGDGFVTEDEYKDVPWGYAGGN